METKKVTLKENSHTYIEQNGIVNSGNSETWENIIKFQVGNSVEADYMPQEITIKGLEKAIKPKRKK